MTRRRHRRGPARPRRPGGRAGGSASRTGSIVAVDADGSAADASPGSEGPYHRAGLRRRPRPRLGRPRCDGRPRGAGRDGPPPPPTRRHVVPADRRDGAARRPSSAFAERVRDWLPDAPADGAEPLGFNLEGPFLADARRGAHDPANLQVPADVPRPTLEPLVDGLAAASRSRPSCPARSSSSAGSASAAWRSRSGHSAATLRRGAGRVRRRRDVDDAPLQRDERRRPPGSRPRRGRAARRRRRTSSSSPTGSTSIRRCGRSSPG